MTLPAPTYDLVLLLDTQLEEEARAKIVADARSAIEAQGELLRYDAWGERALAYPIDKKAGAEYHLLQFHAGTPALLEGLERSLRIIDGIMRFRVVKLKPGVPAAPDMGSPSSSPPRSEPDAEGQPEAGAPPAPEPAAAPEPTSAQEPAAEEQTAGQEPAAPQEPPEPAPAHEPAEQDPAAAVEVGDPS